MRMSPYATVRLGRGSWMAEDNSQIVITTSFICHWSPAACSLLPIRLTKSLPNFRAHCRTVSPLPGTLRVNSSTYIMRKLPRFSCRGQLARSLEDEWQLKGNKILDLGFYAGVDRGASHPLIKISPVLELAFAALVKDHLAPRATNFRQRI